MDGDSNDLLIFKKRGIKVNVENEEQQAPAAQPAAPAPQPIQQQASAQATARTAQQAEGPAPSATQEKPAAKRTAQDNLQGAVGRYCVNHMWRNAYSLCNYCRRPFCYADLAKYDNNFYCLEDIDYVSRRQNSVKYIRNPFSYLAGLAFVLNALVLAYFLYPSGVFQSFFSGITGSGGINFVQTFVLQNTLLAINLAIVAFSFLAGIVITAAPRKGFYFSLLVGLLVLMTASYEYMNSGVVYFLFTTAISLASIALLMYSRMSASTVETDKEVSTNDMTWPRPEVF